MRLSFGSWDISADVAAGLAFDATQHFQPWPSFLGLVALKDGSKPLFGTVSLLLFPGSLYFLMLLWPRHPYLLVGVPKYPSSGSSLEVASPSSPPPSSLGWRWGNETVCLIRQTNSTFWCTDICKSLVFAIQHLCLVKNLIYLNLTSMVLWYHQGKKESIFF